MNALPLSVRQLSITFGGRTVLEDVSFDVAPGERVGIIGGSGSGKTLTALAIAGLLPQHAHVTGSIQLGTLEVLTRPEHELAALRGDTLGIVFQEPKTALSPFRRLGHQMTDALALHYRLRRADRRSEALRLATRVHLGDPERMIRAYPHEVSGGQRQRVAIAAAIAARPGFLIADEPTTALDVTVQREILDLFDEITRQEGCSLVCITHDIAAVQRLVDRILVFDRGRVVESGATQDILERPAHPVTRALIAAATRGESA